MINKGTKVFVTTTNGGEITRELLEDYRPTFGIMLSSANGGWVWVPSWRIKSVRVAA